MLNIITDLLYVLVPKILSSAKLLHQLPASILLEQLHLTYGIPFCAPGSSTACILSLNSLSDVLLAANLGDSGFFVLHGNQVSFKTTPQQYGFNFPYQLALNTFVANRPEQAQGISLPVQPRDVIVIGTDGLWDNLFLEECVEVVTECQNQGLSPEEIAKSLATHAQMRSVDKDASSPFQESAEMNGLEYPNGGKPDDITVIVSVVKETQSQSQTGRID